MNDTNKLRWGQIYSPADVVHYILTHTIDPTLKRVDVRDVKILEPACGDGQFLVPAYELLAKIYQEQGYSQETAAKYVLTNNLYGIDIDETAVDKARQTLAACSGIIPLGVCCGNTLQKDHPLEAVPLLANYFDVVIGNPPYVTWEINSQERCYYRKHYQTARAGKINLYRLFIERAINLLKPGGYLGFICPNTYLTDHDSRYLRQLLLEQTHITEITCLPESVRIFPDITQATTILIAQKGAPTSKQHCTSIKTIVEDKRLFQTKELGSIPQSYWQEKTNGAFCMLPKWYGHIEDKICGTQALSDIAKIYQGEINLTLCKNDLLQRPSQFSFSLVRGRHIIPYGFLPSAEWGSFSCIEPSRTMRDHALKRRIVLQQVSNMTQTQRLKCGLLEPQEPVYCANSTNYILLPNQDLVMYRYIMALCHSTIWNLLFNLRSSTNHITVRELAALPVPICASDKQEHLSDLVKQIMYSPDLTEKLNLEHQINQAVFALFEIEKPMAELITNYCQKYRKRLALF